MKKICLVLIALVIVATFASCGAKKIDMAEYVTVTFDSFNGYSSPELEVDEEAIMAQLDSEKVTDFVTDILGFYSPMLHGAVSADDLFDFDFAADYENLSNGDTVEVVIDVDQSLAEDYNVTLEKLEKELGIKVKDTTITFEVQGLEEAKELDIFADIESVLEYEGASGFAKPSINIPKDYVYQCEDLILTAEGTYYKNQLRVLNNNNELIGVIYYHCDYEGLSNGDVVEVTTDIILNNDLMEMGYVIPMESKEYTVSGLGDYITSTEQIVGDVKTKVFEFVENKVDEKFGAGKTEICGYYLAELKPDKENKRNAPVSAGLIFKYHDSWYGTKYYYAEAYDIILNENGELSAIFYVDSGYNAQKTPEARFDKLNHADYTITECER